MRHYSTCVEHHCKHNWVIQLTKHCCIWLDTWTCILKSQVYVPSECSLAEPGKAYPNLPLDWHQCMIDFWSPLPNPIQPIHHSTMQENLPATVVHGKLAQGLPYHRPAKTWRSTEKTQWWCLFRVYCHDLGFACHDCWFLAILRACVGTYLLARTIVISIIKWCPSEANLDLRWVCQFQTSSYIVSYKVLYRSCKVWNASYIITIMVICCHTAYKWQILRDR